MNEAALITGASRGIGRGIAHALAALGLDLVLNFHSNQTAAERTAAECLELGKKNGHDIRVEIFQADIADSAARRKLVQFTKDQFHRLDLLINNAGIAPKIRADILDASEESFDDLIRTNVKGPYFLTQQVARWMIDLRKSLAADYRPKIITVSSISAYTASTQRGDYCISKAALSMLTPLYASRLAEHGIQVFEIRPGVIATDMTTAVQSKYDALIDQGLTPIKRWGTPEDVGKSVAAIAQNLLPFSTGEILNIDGGFHLRRL